MWRDYSRESVRQNRAASLSVMAAALIASLFLSFLCCMFYNLWVYDVNQILLEEGGWHGRLTGEIGEDDLEAVRNFAGVERAEINEEQSERGETVVDVYFSDVGRTYEEMPLIADQLRLGKDAVTYHETLLSQYLIHDPEDDSPPLLLTFYLVILAAVSVSLILVIRNSFEVTMNERVRQFGIFSSIGATPGQIRLCLVQEAAALCALPVVIGSILGILLSYGAVQGMNAIGADIPGRNSQVFQCHPGVTAAAFLAAALTVLCSAWLPARKLSRMTPLEAIRGTGEAGLKRKKSSPLLAFLFGIEGELAGNGLRARKKSLRTSTLSLVFSFLGFTMMLCFFALTDLSTRYTYTERYQDAWDVMITVKDTEIGDFTMTEALQELDSVEDCVVYQKAESSCLIPDEAVSQELDALGGPAAVAGEAVSRQGDSWLVQAPVVVMDNDSFLRYCETAGISSGLDGSVVLNQFWDSIHSVFRYREYVPYVDSSLSAISMEMEDEAGLTEIPVLGFTQETPALREEYDDYALVQFMPLSLWQTISSEIGGEEEDLYIRLLAPEGADLEELNQLQEEAVSLLEPVYETESENRIQDHNTNADIISSYKLVIGAFCALLAVIGIANVFSYTMGFLRQRKREFAQYMSVGITPGGLKKIFFIEGLVIAGRPVVITIPLTVCFVIFAANASYLNPAEVWPEIPVLLIAGFSLAVFAFVALAYYLGGRRVLKEDFSEILRI